MSDDVVKSKIKVKVIRDKCISCGSCASIAPKVFQLDDEGISTVVDQNGESDEDRLVATKSCPTEAIIATDTESGEQVWPKE